MVPGNQPSQAMHSALLRCCTTLELPLHVGSRDTNVMVWDVTTGQALQTLKGHTYQVAAVRVLPTGEVVSGSLDK